MLRLFQHWTVALGIVVAGALAPVVFQPRRAEATSPVPLAVVVAATNPVTNLSLYELKHLYLGEYVNGLDGNRLIPLNRVPQSPEGLTFGAAVLGMSADQIAAYWIDRRIRGQTGSPRAVASADLAQRMVTHLEGAVTYVRLEDVRQGVKVIRIDGKLPTEPGYRVR